MILEFDGIFIESTPSVMATILACRIYTEHQPCIALFTCVVEDFYKLHAMSLAMLNEDREFYANRFYVEDLITYLDDSMGITVLRHEE